jgi:hypothetical protein
MNYVEHVAFYLTYQRLWTSEYVSAHGRIWYAHRTQLSQGKFVDYYLWAITLRDWIGSSACISLAYPLLRAILL